MKHKLSDKKVGILGGGQLARMMIQSGQNLGLQMYILSEQPNDPAAQVTTFWIKGNPNKKEDLIKFLNTVDIATFESEFLDAPLLQEVSQSTATPISPRPLLMAKLQDRLSQKKLLLKYKIPTASFVAINSVDEVIPLLREFKNGVVLKKRKFGYDGYGTFIVKKEGDLAALEKEIHSFQFGFIAEEFVNFKRELAQTYSRNKKGGFVSFPLSESFQKEAKCLWVKGPINYKKIDAFNKQMRQMLNSINYCGVLTVELFETSKGLLVNEVAPRVHNSAHHSLTSMLTDQFTYHLRSILNMSLPQPILKTKAYAMYNLIGSHEKQPTCNEVQNSRIFWYGKADNRPGRKMGHLNSLGDSADQALKILLKDAKEFSL